MKKKKKRTLYVLAALASVLILLWIGVRLFVPGMVEARLNGVYKDAKPRQVSEAAKRLHARLFIADLHADPLLWGRDLRKRSTRGHIDFPRMREGRLAFQTFSVVTKTPHNLNVERNDDQSDDIFWLGVVSGWPWRALFSLKERTVYLAEQLNRYANAKDGFLVIRDKHNLKNFLEIRENNPSVLGGMLSIEGLHGLNGELGNVLTIYDAGFRLVGLAHFFDNEIAGSAHGVHTGGVTPFGREVITEFEKRKIIVDLAHSSPQTIEEVLKMAKNPVVVSHTGVKGTCDSVRNLSDKQIRAITSKGGLIGIGFWDWATCGNDAVSIARAIAYTVKVGGAEHVALGSDFDGTVTTPFDSSGMVQLTDALLGVGLSESTVEAVMGKNVLRFLQKNLPD